MPLDIIRSASRKEAGKQALPPADSLARPRRHLRHETDDAATLTREASPPYDAQTKGSKTAQQPPNHDERRTLTA